MSTIGTWVAKKAGPSDLVLIYISTAGTPAKSTGADQIFLCAFDTTPESLFASGIDASRLPAMIRDRCHAQRVILMIDASYSGGTIAHVGKAGDFSRLSSEHSEFQDWGGTGQATLCSSESDQRSYECKTKSNSAFTFQFMQSARKLGKAATLRQIFDETAAAVRTEVESERHTKQTPIANFSGDAAQLQIAAPVMPAGSEAKSK